jgi:hypothetical protein
MVDIEYSLNGYIYSTFKNIQMKTYILKGFYDVSINKTVYFKINVLSIKKENLNIYRIGSQIFSIKLNDINDFWVTWDYRSLNFKVPVKINFNVYFLHGEKSVYSCFVNFQCGYFCF